MMVIKVEVWPGGSEDRAREVGRIALANVSNLHETSDYVFLGVDDRGESFQGEVLKHKRSSGFWGLVHRICNVEERGEVPAKHEGTIATLKRKMSAHTNPPPCV